MALKIALYVTLIALAFVWIGEPVMGIGAKVHGKIAKIERALNR